MKKIMRTLISFLFLISCATAVLGECCQFDDPSCPVDGSTQQQLDCALHNSANNYDCDVDGGEEYFSFETTQQHTTTMDNLKKFLTAVDLDDALGTSREVDRSNAEVEKAIRDVINNKWDTDKQAVYNLLQNSFVIPEDIRFNTLMKGIDDMKITAYNLAAVVGLQSYGYSADQLPIAKEKLIRLAASDSTPANARAMTSLSDLTKYPDDLATFLKIYATTSCSSVKYGARANILRHYNSRPKEEFVAAITALNLLSAEDLDSLASTHGNDDLTFGFLSYIPNLIEIEPMERYRERILSFFDEVDVTKKGKITAAEFCEFLQAVGNPSITTEKAAEMIKEAKGYKHFDDCTFLTRADWYDILQGKLRFKDIDYPLYW